MEFNALFLSRFDFQRVSRSLRFCSAVNDMDFSVRHTNSRARAVHGYVAAPDNHKVAGERRRFAFNDAAFHLKQKVQTVGISFNRFIVFGEAEFHALGTAHADEHGVKAFVEQIIQCEIFS